MGCGVALNNFMKFIGVKALKICVSVICLKMNFVCFGGNFVCKDDMNFFFNVGNFFIFL